MNSNPMLIDLDESNAKQRQNLQALERMWAQTASYRRGLRDVLLAYQGDQIGLMRPNSGESSNHFKSKPKFASNMLARVVEEKSFLYDSEPIRRFPDSADPDAMRALWRQYMYDVDGPGVFNAHMDELDPIVWLHGAVADWAEWDEDEGGVEWTTLSRDRFEVLSHQREPEDVRAIIAAWSEETTADGEKIVWMRYADDEVQAWVKASNRLGSWAFDEDENGEKFVPHGLGVVPVSVDRNRVSHHGTFEGPRLGGADLLENTRTLAQISTEGVTATRMKRGQMWVAGRFAKDAKPVISPEIVWRLEKNGTAGGISNGADLAGFESMYQLMSEAYAINGGVGPDVLRLKNTVVESGKAILVRRAAKQRIATKRRRCGQDWEHRKHRLAALIVRRHAGVELDPRVWVEYPQGVPLLTVEDRLAVATFAMERGLLPQSKVLAFLFDELPPEEITRLLDAADFEANGGVDDGGVDVGIGGVSTVSVTAPAKSAKGSDTEEFDDRTGQS